MKTYIKETKLPVSIDIEVEIEYFGDTQFPVAAAEYKGFKLPEGPIISGVPDVILDSQALADYEDFIESVTDLITDYYKFHIYYKNTSPDHSYYFGLLVKNDDNTILIDFDFTLRLSNHDAHRSTDSQKHKKEQKAELHRLTNGKSTKPITRSIIVNGELFDSYLDAYEHVDNIVGEVAAKMKKNQKYRNK